MNNATNPKGIYSRGYLPHVDGADLQMITYRLNDALPVEVVKRLRTLPSKTQRMETEQAMDSGYGCCCLRRPDIAALVIDNWRYFNGQRYQLIAWVVMPNHVHVLIEVAPGEPLARIVQGWKSYTGKQIGLLMAGALKPVWQPDYWDRYIRNEAHYLSAIEYIHQNPVKAGLVKNVSDWPWSSAYAGKLPALPAATV